MCGLDGVEQTDDRAKWKGIGPNVCRRNADFPIRTRHSPKRGIRGCFSKHRATFLIVSPPPVDIGFYLAFLDRNPRATSFSPHPKSPVWIPMWFELQALIFVVAHSVVEGHNA